MTKGYYLSKKIGAGTEDDPIRLAVEDAAASAAGGAKVVTILSDGPNWGLALIESADHAPMRADANTVALPVLTWDASVSGMASQTRSTMQAGFSKFGINPGNLGSYPAWRDLIRWLGRRHYATFDENRFDTDGAGAR